MSSNTRRFAIVDVLSVLSVRIISEPAKTKEMMSWLSQCSVEGAKLKEWMVLIHTELLEQCPDGFWSREIESKIKECGVRSVLTDLVAQYGNEIELRQFPEDWISNQKKPAVTHQQQQPA